MPKLDILAHALLAGTCAVSIATYEFWQDWATFSLLGYSFALAIVGCAAFIGIRGGSVVKYALALFAAGSLTTALHFQFLQPAAEMAIADSLLCVVGCVISSFAAERASKT